MLTITDGGSLSRALTLPINLELKRLLIERRDQLGGDIKDIARFIVVQPGDSIRAVEDELGWSVFENLTDGSWFGGSIYLKDSECVGRPGPFAWRLQQDFPEASFSNLFTA